jgi:sodium pump decarboxylase gamma subunit
MEADLLTVFSDPSKFESLTATQRLSAALITTVLGMGITFVVLILLQFVLGLFDKFAGPQEQPKAAAPKAAPKKAEVEPVSQTDDELVPVIAASLAVMLQTPASNIVIRDVRRLEDRSSPWSRAGVVDQMQTRA